MNLDVAGLTRETLLLFYQRMCTIRRFELAVSELFAQGQVPGSVHLSIGQEGCAVGACSALAESDYLVTTHRGHGHVIARGVNINRLMAEILGRETGFSRGKAGSLHIADYSHGVIGAMSIVGGGLPVATGAALAAQMRREGQVVISFFGEGATHQGTFHESLNIAQRWSLPIIYLCENNGYILSTRYADVSASTNVADLAAGYRMHAEIVDGNNVCQVYRAAQQAVARARQGGGPTLLECKTYRWHGHFEGEDVVFSGRMYRTREEIEEWKHKDPIPALGRQLCAEGLATELQLAELDRQALQTVEAAAEFAQASPLPRPEQALESVYAP